jgi:hypothetical protein
VGQQQLDAGTASINAAATKQPVQTHGHVSSTFPSVNSHSASSIRDSFSDTRETELWDTLVAAQCKIDWESVVQGQLKQWADTGISYRQVQEHCVRRTARLSFVQGEMRLAVYKMDGGNLHRLRCGFWLIYMAALRASARGIPLPPFEINLQPGDSAFSNAPPRLQWENAGPVLGNVKCNDASVSFPLTLHDQFGFGAPDNGGMSLTRYAARYKEASSWGEGKQYSGKIPKAYFSAGGGATLRGNRGKLFKLQSPHLQPDNISHTMDYMAGFQYNVYAYGNCGWSRRIHELAMMETVVLIEDSPCREYMHGLFQGGQDHIPVADNFEDLVSALETSIKVPEVAAKMANRWVRQGRAMLSIECTLDYVEQLLRLYSKLQRFTPKYHKEWPQYFPNTTSQFFTQPAAKRPADECIKPDYNGTWQRQARRSHSC